MKKIMYRAVFNRKKQLRADGKGLIQIEAYLERKRMYVSTHIYIYIARNGTTSRHSSAYQPTPQ